MTLDLKDLETALFGATGALVGLCLIFLVCLVMLFVYTRGLNERLESLVMFMETKGYRRDGFHDHQPLEPATSPGGAFQRPTNNPYPAEDFKIQRPNLEGLKPPPGRFNDDRPPFKGDDGRAPWQRGDDRNPSPSKSPYRPEEDVRPPWQKGGDDRKPGLYRPDEDPRSSWQRGDPGPGPGRNPTMMGQGGQGNSRMGPAFPQRPGRNVY